MASFALIQKETNLHETDRHTLTYETLSISRWLEPWTSMLASFSFFFVISDFLAFWSLGRLRKAILGYYQGSGGYYE